MSYWRVVLGASIVLVSLVGVVLADTGPGGGCHANFYLNVDAAGAITAYVLDCEEIDCPGDCPDPAAGPGTGGFTTCYCPTKPGICNFGYRLIPGGMQATCLWGCPDARECWGHRPAGGGYYPGGTVGGVTYAHKMTCWCE